MTGEGATCVHCGDLCDRADGPVYMLHCNGRGCDEMLCHPACGEAYLRSLGKRMRAAPKNKKGGYCCPRPACKVRARTHALQRPRTLGRHPHSRARRAW